VVKRIVVVYVIMLDSRAHLVYNASTWKPVCLKVTGVPVVASSARKFACGVGSAGSRKRVKQPAVKQVLERSVSRFTTF
jgi:hypothetical protein